MKIWLLGVPNGMMSLPNFIRILCVCTLVQKTYNFYCTGIGDLDPPYYRAAREVLTLGLHGLPVCCCNVWPAGLCVRLDTGLIKDNLHNHVNVRLIVLVYVTSSNSFPFRTQIISETNYKSLIAWGLAR
jgi:hypothetical protein